ncbi:MAG: cob(I)yrinic acid a,c-diamide adenosyltransferase [Planctomycetota bacterium]
MVHINRVYTRTGDAGTTRLADGSEVAKTDARMQACGDVDEFGAILGLILSSEIPAELASALRRIQNDCFDLGADLATPLDGPYEERIPRIRSSQVTRLEDEIDAANERLQPLRSFILAGGRPVAAWMHLARCVVRRAERSACQIPVEMRNPEALKYINRLSDWCFVQARLCNDDGRSDVLWQPGANA